MTEAKAREGLKNEGKKNAARNNWLRTGEGRENFVITTGIVIQGALVPVEVQTPVIVRRMWNAYINACLVGGQPIINDPSTRIITLPVMDDLRKRVVKYWPKNASGDTGS